MDINSRFKISNSSFKLSYILNKYFFCFILNIINCCFRILYKIKEYIILTNLFSNKRERDGRGYLNRKKYSQIMKYLRIHRSKLDKNVKNLI